MKKLLLSLVVLATLNACTTKETKNADATATATTQDPQTGTFTSLDEKSANVKELLEACRNYPNVSNARRITFEYVMLKGVNDSVAEARKLVQLIRGIPAKINLIPFNPFPASGLLRSTGPTVQAFARRLNDAGLVTTAHPATMKMIAKMKGIDTSDFRSLRNRFLTEQIFIVGSRKVISRRG
jgi:hypothetical protein